jgi:hypothetical protein
MGTLQRIGEEAKARQEAKGDTDDEDPNISDGGTLLVIYVCRCSFIHNAFFQSFNNFLESWFVIFKI